MRTATFLSHAKKKKKRKKYAVRDKHFSVFCPSGNENHKLTLKLNYSALCSSEGRKQQFRASIFIFPLCCRCKMNLYDLYKSMNQEAHVLFYIKKKRERERERERGEKTRERKRARERGGREIKLKNNISPEFQFLTFHISCNLFCFSNCQNSLHSGRFSRLLLLQFRSGRSILPWREGSNQKSRILFRDSY